MAQIDFFCFLCCFHLTIKKKKKEETNQKEKQEERKRVKKGEKIK